MIAPIEALLTELDQALLVVEQGDGNKFQKCKLGIHHTQQALIALNKYITLHPLPNLEEKVRFHKIILPEVNAQLIYHINIYQLETRLPPSALFARKKYYEKHLKAINQYFNLNKKLFRYYKNGDSHLDSQLFIDAPLQLELPLEEFSFVADYPFINCQSSRLARIIAYERLQAYYHNALADLNHNKVAAVSPETGNYSLQWTEQKSALIELAYALHSRGCMNSGRLTIKQVIQLFEQIFQIDLGNFYRVFQGQRIRKNRAVFLDNLKESLIKKMDDTDEHYL